jgi:hypothetical protein
MSIDQVDRNCVTLPDGNCVGNGCMHDVPSVVPALPDVGPLNALAREIHLVDNWRWWHDLVTGERLDRNKGELICLMHSELSEAMEGERKNLMDDKLPHRKMAEVELADTLIRIFDYAGAYGYDLDGAVRFHSRTSRL